MTSLLGLFTKSIVLQVMWPLLILVIGYVGTAYVRLGWMESKIEQIQKQNYEIQVELSVCKEVIDGATGQIQLAEEQCKRLIEYEKNRPKPQPSRDDDSDIDALVDRLQRQNAGSKANAAGKNPGAASPASGADQSWIDTVKKWGKGLIP